MIVLKSILLCFASLSNRIYNIIILKYRNVEYSEKLKINGRILIIGNGTLNIGYNVKINSNKLSNPIGGDFRTILSIDSGALLEIGDGTGVSNISIVCKKHIKIGKNVRIGGSTKIYDSDFHSLDYKSRISKNDISVSKPIEVKEGAFIGAHCIILKGVSVGKRSIIGAGSVVTKSVPDGELWGGNPAKFIREIS